MEEKWIIKVFAQEIAGEEVIDDANPSSDGNIHVIGLRALPIQITLTLRILGLPWRLLG